MQPILKVIAATDFSRAGKQAARRAGWLAAGHSAELTVVHVDEPDALISLRDLFDPARNLTQAVAEQVRMQLDVLSQEIEQRHGLRVQRQLRAGKVLEELKAAADEADLLVLGARGASPVREFVLGSTAERLVRLAKRPVVVVRGEPAGHYERVLVAVDFSAASEAALREALRVAPQASFHLLHCYDVPYEGKLRVAGVSDSEIEHYRAHEATKAQQQFRDLLDRLGDVRSIGTIFRRGDPRLELLQIASELDVDLVALGKQGRSLVSDALLGSLTSWAMAESPCDVLVVPAGAAPA